MDNPLLYLLFGLLVAWVGSYFFSITYNRRRLRALALWLKEALPLLGSRQSSTWRGADRLDIMINEGRGNIREAALVAGMQSRQFFRLIVSTLRGGRDSLTLLVSLQKPPAPGNEFEIYETKGPLPRSLAVAAGTATTWEIEDYSRSTAYKLAGTSPAGREIAARVLTLLLDDGFNVRRFTVRPGAPQMLLVLNIGVLPRGEAAALLRLVRSVAEEVAQPARSSGPGTGKPPKSRSKTERVAGKTLPPIRPTPDGYHTSNGHKDN